MITAGGTILGAMKITDIDGGGGLGWLDQAVASVSGATVVVGGDVIGPRVRALEGLRWEPLALWEQLPPAMQSITGAVYGTYAICFAGDSETLLYWAHLDRVVKVDRSVASPGGVTSTALTGINANGNLGVARTFAGKIVSDPASQDTCVLGAAGKGTFATFDGGVNFPRVTGVPLPTHPYTSYSGDNPYVIDQRYTLQAMDPTSPTANRRFASAPCGQGIFLWDRNSPGSATKIAGPGMSGAAGKICGVSDIQYAPDGTLWCCVVSTGDVTLWTDSLIPLGTPAAGNTHFVLEPNIASWTAANGWVIHPGIVGARHLCKETGDNGKWFMVDSVGNWHRTADNFASVMTWAGGPANTPPTFVYRQTKIRTQPMMVEDYRAIHGAGAPSRPIIVGPRMLVPIGLGLLRINVGDWPTQGANYTVPHWSARWPVFEEDSSGLSELVGQSARIRRNGPMRGKRIVLHGQDRPVSNAPEVGKGQAVITNHQITGFTDCTGSSEGAGGFAAYKMTRGGAKISWSADDYDFHLCVNQPTGSNTALESGMALAGEPGQIFVWPCSGDSNGVADPVNFPQYPYGQAFPQYTEDYGVTWNRCTFVRLDGSTYDVTTTKFTGFGGSAFAADNHLTACRDPATGHLYKYNCGGIPGDGSYGTVHLDPANVAGLWRHRPGVDPSGRWYQVIDRLPLGGNWAVYGGQLIPDGLGHLIFRPNRNTTNDQWMPNQGNPVFLIDLASMTAQPFPQVTNVGNVAMGPPLPGFTKPSLTFYGYNQADVFGTFVLPDYLDAPAQGPFGHHHPGGGEINMFDGHPDHAGEYVAAIGSQGFSTMRIERKLV